MHDPVAKHPRKKNVDTGDCLGNADNGMHQFGYSNSSNKYTFAEKLTASKFEWAGVGVHREVFQLHGTLS